MKFYCRFVVSKGGFALVTKTADVMVRPKCLNTSHPDFVSLVPINTLVLRTGLPLLLSLVEMILTTGYQTQIAASVIKTVSVNVVNLYAIWGVQYRPMHQNSLL
jgi:hypothetical protein